MQRPFKLSTAALLLALLAACAGQPASDHDAYDDEGPTIYGQIGVSVDHVSVE